MAELRDLLSPANEVALALLNLQKADVMCDITLVAEDSSITKAHKLILFAVSPYFQNLYENENSFDTFLFKGASPYTVTSLVQYLYGNVHAIDRQNARDIYPFAVQLGLMHVVSLCDFLVPDISFSHFDFEETCILPIVHKSTSPKRKLYGPLSVKKRRIENALGNETTTTKSRVLGTVTKIAISSEPLSSQDDNVGLEDFTSPKRKKKVKKKKAAKENEADATPNQKTTGRDDSSHKKKTIPSKNSGEIGREIVYRCAICDQFYPTIESVENHIRTDLCCNITTENVPEETNPDDLDWEVPCLNTNEKFVPSDKVKQVLLYEQEFALWSETILLEGMNLKNSLSDNFVGQEKIELNPAEATPELASLPNNVTDNIPDPVVTQPEMNGESVSVPDERTSFECMLCQRSHSTLGAVQKHMQKEHGYYHTVPETNNDGNSDGSEGNKSYPNLSVKFSPGNVASDLVHQQEEFSLWKEAEASNTLLAAEKKNSTSSPRTAKGRRSTVENRGVMVEDEVLPEGWKKVLVERLGGKFAGRRDIHFISPTGKKFKYKKQMEEYFAGRSDGVDLSKFNFSMTAHKSPVSRSTKQVVRTPNNSKLKSKTFFKGTPRIMLSGSFKTKSNKSKTIDGKDGSPGKKGVKRKRSGSLKSGDDECFAVDDENLSNTDDDQSDIHQSLSLLRNASDPSGDNLSGPGNSIAKELMMSIIGHIEFEEGDKAGQKKPVNNVDSIENVSTPEHIEEIDESNTTEENEIENIAEESNEDISQEFDSTNADLDEPVTIKEEIIDDD